MFNVAIYMERSGGAGRLWGGLLILATALPLWMQLSVMIKRWHDRDKRGWWVLIVLVPIIGWWWTVIEPGFIAGYPGRNRFGEGPVKVFSRRTLIGTFVFLALAGVLIVGTIRSVVPGSTASSTGSSGLGSASNGSASGQYLRLVAPYDRDLAAIGMLVHTPTATRAEALAAFNRLSGDAAAFNVGLDRLQVNKPTSVDIQALVDANNGIMYDIHAMEQTPSAEAPSAISQQVLLEFAAASRVPQDLGLPLVQQAS